MALVSPLVGGTDSSSYLGRLLFQDHPEHDRGRKGQGVPVAFCQ